MPDDMEALATGVKAAMEVLFEPLKDLVQKMAGPAAEELGLTFGETCAAVPNEARSPPVDPDEGNA